MDSLLLQKTIDYYLNSLYAENKSPKTVKAYSMNLALFRKHLGDPRIGDIGAMQIRDFLGTRARTVQPATLHQAFRVLRSFFNWCKREGFIEKSPLENIKAPDLKKKIIPTYTREEIQAMLAACPLKKFKGARDRAIISIFLDAGIREAELVGIKLNDVDFRGGAIKVYGKGNKERIVHINEKARQALWRYMILRDLKAGSNQRIFLSESMKPLTEDGLRTVIKKIGKAAGIQEVYIHKFRHTCAIEFLRSGGDPVTLQHMLGHSNIATTMRYLTALSSDDVIRAHTKFSPGDKFL